MIKVGITGCDDLRAAELVRLLINHPDVEIQWVTASCPPGTRLEHLVPGIIGECDLVVADTVDCDEVDIVFIGAGLDKLPDTVKTQCLSQDCHVVDLTGEHNLDHGEDKLWTYGMGEMQRRVLVHDAHHVTVPGGVAMATLLALMPMAHNLLLNNPITVHAAVGDCALNGNDESLEQWARQQTDEVMLALSQCQSSFNQPVVMDITRLAERRMLAVAVRFKCGLEDEALRQLYEQYYDDHNFVFIVDRPIVAADVENTNKCLIRIDKDDRKGWLTVHAVMDGLLKGGAGNAVHVMNLMFGLLERVGLGLKATGC